MAAKKKHKRSIHNPAVPITADIINQYLGGGARSAAGVVVNHHTALKVAPVWQAIDVITADISRIPIEVKRATADGRGEEPDKKHPARRLLSISAGDMTANVFISRLLAHALLFGNGYAQIMRRGNRPTKLHWLLKNQVEPCWENGKFFYLVQYDGNKDGRADMQRVLPIDMIHLPGLLLDEFGGLSLIDYARNTIGREIAAETFGDDFFSNSAVPSGWFEHPAEMGEEAHKRFLQSVERRHQGSGKRHRVGILEEGMKWNPAGVNPVDAMLIDVMKWGTKDVARFFNLPPHKLGDDSRVNYNSLEQENKAYYDSSLGKWISRLTCEFNAKLFTDEELDEGYRVEFDIDSWGKADTAARFASYAIAIQWGIMNRNEVRQREGLNPYEGGDEYLTPLTHGDTSAATDMPQEDSDASTEPIEEITPQPTDQARALIYDLVRERLEESARLLVNSTTRAAKRGGNFLAYLNNLQEKHGSAVEGKLGPAIRMVRDNSDIRPVVDRVFGEAVNRFLAASECPAELLVTRVADAGEALRVGVQQLARDLVYGVKNNVN